MLVTVDFLPNRFTVEVEDDGMGFDARSVLARGVQQERGGLMGMLERAELLGGWRRVESMPGTGCLVEFSMPLEPASQRSRRQMACIPAALYRGKLRANRTKVRGE